VSYIYYRGKFQARIKSLILSDEVKLPPNECRETLMMIHKPLYKKAWSIRIQEKYEHGKGVLIYLSRYLGSCPIKPQQIHSVNHDTVTFNYKDHRDGKYKSRRLTMKAFMHKLLMHQPEMGTHTIRYYGLYGVQSKPAYAISVNLLGKAETQDKTASNSPRLGTILSKTYQTLCECCGTVMQPAYVHFAESVIKKTIIKGGEETSHSVACATRSLCSPTSSSVLLRPDNSDIILNV